MQPDPINGLVTNLTLPIKCFCNYLSPLYEGQNIQAALKRSKPMSILKKLRRELIRSTSQNSPNSWP